MSSNKIGNNLSICKFYHIIRRLIKFLMFIQLSVSDAPQPSLLVVEASSGSIKVSAHPYCIYAFTLKDMDKSDWLWGNQPVMHKDNYLEKRNWIIQGVLSHEGLKLHTGLYLLHSYSYSRSIRLPSPQCVAS